MNINTIIAHMDQHVNVKQGERTHRNVLSSIQLQGFVKWRMTGL